MIEVSAPNEKLAKHNALDRAGNLSFSEHDADYEIEHIKELGSSSNG